MILGKSEYIKKSRLESKSIKFRIVEIGVILKNAAVISDILQFVVLPH
jgi:hypothetical protein